MAFPLQDLDNRSYQDLFDAAKRRISAYTDEWTDHNDSDPGITLLQMFAWLTETVIFRLNLAPDERMYSAFLDLMGLSPAAATSAVAILGLEVDPGGPPGRYARHELRFSAPGSPDDVDFEADAPVPTLGASLGLLLVHDGISPMRVDVTRPNETGDQPFAPFGQTNVDGRALYLGLDTAPRAGGTPPPLIPPGSSAELQLYVRTDEQAKPLTPASSTFGEQMSSIESDLTWEARGVGKAWIELRVELDETHGFVDSGLVRVRIPDTVAPYREPDDPDNRPRFWLRVRPTASQGPEMRRIRYLLINAVRVRQWTTHVNELLVPGSDGTPGQTRRVRHAPMLDDDTLTVEVHESNEHGDLQWTPWEQVADLATRATKGVVQAGDRPLRVYRILPDRSGIEFGDGLNGLIPPRGANNLRITYRSGGGSRGNVGAGKIGLAVSKPGIAGVRQLEVASGGRDEESIDEAKKEAPDRIRTLERAVTARDFETLAENISGVARAVALNRYHPLYPGAPVTGAVTLVVVPHPIGVDTAQLPEQAVLDHVAATLERYRVLTTELFVVAPRFRDVAVTVEIEVAREADAAEARANVQRALAAYLDPIVGGRDGGGWPLGGEIVHGELMSVALTAGKVSAVKSLVITLDGEAQLACTDVMLAADPSRSLDLIRAAIHVRVAAPSRRR